jgi:hypothetical protein
MINVFEIHKMGFIHELNSGINYFNSCRVNVHNLAQAVNWRSLVKTSLELQSRPLFQINVVFGTPK